MFFQEALALLKLTKLHWFVVFHISICGTWGIVCGELAHQLPPCRWNCQRCLRSAVTCVKTPTTVTWSESLKICCQCYCCVIGADMNELQAHYSMIREQWTWQNRRRKVVNRGAFRFCGGFDVWAGGLTCKFYKNVIAGIKPINGNQTAVFSFSIHFWFLDQTSRERTPVLLPHADTHGYRFTCASFHIA